MIKIFPAVLVYEKNIMTAQKNIGRYFWILLAVILFACQSQEARDVTPATMSVTSIGGTPTFTSSLLVPELSTPTLSSDTLPTFPLDGYVVAYIDDGKLYFKDGEGLPVKLTDVGETHFRPAISDDNKKIIFTNSNGDVNSINADGADERIVIPKDWLTSLYMRAGDRDLNYELIPTTHDLLVKVIVCASREFRSLCLTSLYIAYTDTGKIRKMNDLGLAHQQNFPNGNIVISPNGEMIAVGTLDGTDIFTLDGKMIRENVLPYESITPRFPFLHWLSDSSGLTIALPDKEYESVAYDNFPAYSIWSYSIESDLVIQSPIDPTRIAGYFDISSDGKWIVYGGLGFADPDLYLGNLITGDVQFFDKDPQTSFIWSPDNKYFTYGHGMLNRAAVDDLTPRRNNCGLLWWVDGNHFVCGKSDNPSVGSFIGKVDGDNVEIYNHRLPQSVRSLFFIKPK